MVRLKDLDENSKRKLNQQDPEAYYEGTPNYDPLEDARNDLNSLNEKEVQKEFEQKFQKRQSTEASEREWKKPADKSKMEEKRERLEKLRAEKLQKEEERKLDRELYAEEHPTRAKLKAIPKKVGNIIVSGTKEIISDGHGRSGKRATLAYRRANREYRSEARKIRSEVNSPGMFSSMMMFGENRVPQRTRYVGHDEFAGTGDPLTNFSSGILGLPNRGQPAPVQKVQKVKKQKRTEQKPREPEESPLTRFGKSLRNLRL